MSKTTFMPDYNRSIVGIPNSILAHYGAKPHHNTLPILDERLRRQYKNVVLLVLDGMGLAALQAHAPDGFLMQHCAAQLSSVYPCTTTSALTTFETGLTPIEHGWLGWSQYFAQIDACVDLFTGNKSGTDRPAASENIVWDAIGYQNLFTQIKEVDESVKGCVVSPFGEYRCDTNEGICTHVEAICQEAGRHYIYAYHFQPDKDMHDSGCYSERTKADIVLFDKQIEALAGKVEDTLLIVTADHGLTDIKMLDIADYPEIEECLSAPPTREPRSLSLFVKPEYMGDFPRRWNKQFGEDFRLMTSAQAIESGMFGSGAPHKHAKDFLGDYVALGIGGLAVWYKNENGALYNFKACHAGPTEEEMIVPLILIER